MAEKINSMLLHHNALVHIHLVYSEWTIHSPYMSVTSHILKVVLSSYWKSISVLRGVTWDHTMLLATQHKRTKTTLTLASEGWYSIYLPRRDGRLS